MYTHRLYFTKKFKKGTILENLTYEDHLDFCSEGEAKSYVTTINSRKRIARGFGSDYKIIDYKIKPL